MKNRRASMALALLAAGLMAGCSDDSTQPEQTRTFEVTLENVFQVYDFPESGTFTTPVGAAGPGPATPGGAFEVTFDAPPGSRLSFASMFAQSNDFFVGPDGGGIELWDGSGDPIDGDVTDQVFLWDAGTEANEEPGVGPNQAPRQGAPNTGPADPVGMVRLAPDTYGNLPAISDFVRVSVHSMGETSFRLTIENLDDGTKLMASDGMGHPIPLSPGVWVVHTTNDPLFAVGQPDRGQGLEGIAEDGAASALAASVAARTGLTSPIAPGVYAVHTVPSVLFRAGMPDAGLGLEALAEDANPSALSSSLESDSDVSDTGVYDTPDGASSPGPIMPGQTFTFTVTAGPGDRLSFASMLGQSNDLFFAPSEAGIDLFPGGTALSGDATGMVLLWDAGTEVNQVPGIGVDQAPRQSGPDTGADENGNVRQVNDGFDYPEVEDMIRVSITPVG